MVERDAHEECLGEGYFDKGVLSDALFLTYRNFANFTFSTHYTCKCLIFRHNKTAIMLRVEYMWNRIDTLCIFGGLQVQR